LGDSADAYTYNARVHMNKAQEVTIEREITLANSAWALRNARWVLQQIGRREAQGRTAGDQNEG